VTRANLLWASVNVMSNAFNKINPSHEPAVSGLRRALMFWLHNTNTQLSVRTASGFQTLSNSTPLYRTENRKLGRPLKLHCLIEVDALTKEFWVACAVYRTCRSTPQSTCRNQHWCRFSTLRTDILIQIFVLFLIPRTEVFYNRPRLFSHTSFKIYHSPSSDSV
jgi:hypothetical protein